MVREAAMLVENVKLEKVMRYKAYLAKIESGGEFNLLARLGNRLP